MIKMVAIPVVMKMVCSNSNVLKGKRKWTRPGTTVAWLRFVPRCMASHALELRVPFL